MSIIAAPIAAPAPTFSSNPETEQRAAVAQARQGQYEAALKRLSALVQAYPAKPAFQYDYINVLAWAGRDEEVLAQLPRIDLGRTPGYVLVAIGKSARNRQQPELAIKVYRAALKQTPDEQQARLGLAMGLAEAKYPDKASEQMEILLKANSKSVELLAALAYVKEADHNYAAAIGIYDRLLAIAPGHRGAQRGRILNLLRLGAPHQAIRLARRNTELFSAGEWQRMVGEQAATLIRWGRLPTLNPAERYRDIDTAIKLLQNQYGQLVDKTSTVARRNRFDLINAYRNRRRMREAVALYEQLREQNVKSFPPHVLAAAGEAYLSLRQPEQAVALLEQSLSRYPTDSDAQYALYYAYLESGRYEESLTHIDEVAASLPQWRWPPGDKKRQWNLDKVYAQTIAAMARAYVNQLDAAEQRLSSLARQVPANADVRSNLARVYLWRSWPHQASNEYRATSALYPEHLDTRTGTVDALMARGDVVAADEILAPLLLQYGDLPALQNLARKAETRKMRELWLEVKGGSSTSVYQGSSGLGFATDYYDRPWRPGLRPFASLLRTQASFFDQTVSRNRLAAGLDYQYRDVVLRGSLSDGDGPPGVSLQGDWLLTDHWRGHLSLDSFSNQTPLQADLANVKAWSLAASTEYRFHESRSLGLTLQYMNFNDGNRRNTLSAYGRQRLINGMRYKLEGELNFYHQTNNMDGAAYFNPSRHNTIELGLANEWFTYTHYEKTMRQRLRINIGTNRQQNFDREITWLLGYEHHWQFNHRLNLNYGISRSRPVYDGVQEFTTRGFINLYARF